MTDFWDLHYIWYILGFLLAPRITMIVIFSYYVTDGFRWYNLFVPITVFWKYPVLQLAVWMKLLFFVLFAAFPRVLLGITGIMFLPENQTAMIVLTILGFLIDGHMNRERRKKGFSSSDE